MVMSSGLRSEWLDLPRHMVRRSDIRRKLRVEQLRLCIERSQLRWFGHLIRMPAGHFPLRARPSILRPWTLWRDYIYCVKVTQEELGIVAGEKEAWNILLSLLPPRPDFG